MKELPAIQLYNKLLTKLIIFQMLIKWGIQLKKKTTVFDIGIDILYINLCIVKKKLF